MRALIYFSRRNEELLVHCIPILVHCIPSQLDLFLDLFDISQFLILFDHDGDCMPNGCESPANIIDLAYNRCYMLLITATTPITAIVSVPFDSREATAKRGARHQQKMCRSIAQSATSYR